MSLRFGISAVSFQNVKNALPQRKENSTLYNWLLGEKRKREREH